MPKYHLYAPKRDDANDDYDNPRTIKWIKRIAFIFALLVTLIVFAVILYPFFRSN